MSPPPTDPYITPSEPISLAPPPARHPLAVQSFGITDRGQVRSNNEDQFLIAELTKAMRVQHSSLPQARTQYSQQRGYLFIVADGMGGHRAGKEASALAVETIEEFVLNTLKWFFHLKGTEEHKVLSEFQTGLRQADDRLFAEAAQHPEFRGMGTTLTMAYSLDTDLFVVHVGDSRCYLFRAGEMHQLTQDHTLVAEMARRGMLNPAEAAGHRLRHVITNVVGGHQAGVQVEAHKLGLEAGDRLLLCTDGLTGMLSVERIRDILQTEPQPREACTQLVAEANQQGGRDNITVIVARFDAPA
jgi:protein phosphatase